MPDVFTHRLRVRYGECDVQGVVFNANWLAYFDVVITELWRLRAGGYNEMVEQGVDMMVGEASIRFRGSARFDEEVEFRLTVTNMSNSALSTRIEAWVDDTLAVEGSMRHVFVDARTHAKRPIPDHIRAALSPLRAEAGAPA